MKIGIVTFHCSYNFGSALQAFALQESVSRLGHESWIIDYRSSDFDQYKLFSPNHPKKQARTILGLPRLMKRRDSFGLFWGKYFHLTIETYSYRDEDKLASLSDSFDAFVCGSDQIWNLDCTHGVVDPYFLSFAGDKRRIAYAPSLAHTSFEPVNFDKKKVSSLLSRFDSISVREEETVPLFQPLVQKKIEVVLDPTLLLDASDYSDMTRRKFTEDPYLFVYLLRSCPELIQSINEYASRTGSRVFYVSEKNLPIVNSINLFGIGPAEFVSLAAHADAIMTNSFHATVFSVLFHKPFRAFGTDKSASRMRDLLSNLGIENCFADEVCSEEMKPVDWQIVDANLAELRDHSLNYLREALS